MKTVIKVAEGSNHLVTGDNQTLYCFAPSKTDPDHMQIPWSYKWGELLQQCAVMPEWSDYMRNWIESWIPLEVKGNLRAEGLSQDDLTSVDRKKKGDKGKFAYPQAIYKTWWLYTYEHDKPGEITGKVKDLWDIVAVDRYVIDGFVGNGGNNYSGGP